jgi:hypothetical protein
MQELITEIPGQERFVFIVVSPSGVDGRRCGPRVFGRGRRGGLAGEDRTTVIFACLSWPCTRKCRCQPPMSYAEKA